MIFLLLVWSLAHFTYKLKLLSNMTIKYVFSMLFLGPDLFIIPSMLELKNWQPGTACKFYNSNVSDYLSVECEKGKRSCIWQLFMEMMPKMIIDVPETNSGQSLRLVIQSNDPMNG